MGKSNVFASARERQAEKSAERLRVIQRRLAESGIRTLLVRKVRLSLRAPRPVLPGWPGPGLPEYQAPELVVFGPEGKQIASVGVGARSGCYVISGGAGIGLRTADGPDRVAELLTDGGAPLTGQEPPTS